jgi:2-methylcitrate dehydratase PrpD
MTTLIDIELKDGRKISGRADFGKGSPAFPMSYDEVANKFRENAEFAGMSRSKADEIVELVRGLETLSTLDDLSARLISVA